MVPAPLPPSAVIVVGGSAGSLRPLSALVAGLPPDLDAAVMIVTHVGSQRSRLSEVLGRVVPLPTSWAQDGETLHRGHVYVAPPGRHLMVHGGRVRLSRGPKVNRHRPAVDVLFASAARWAARDVVAVVLSGVMDDAAAGAALIDRAGGRVLVQDPEEADFATMPMAALHAAGGARAVPTEDLATEATAEVRRRGPDQPVAAEPDEQSLPPDDVLYDALMSGLGEEPTRLVCPDCGGSLGEIRVGRTGFYRCHVGHHYSPGSLVAAQAETVEERLWSAVAAMEEHAFLRERLSGVGGAAAAVTGGDDELEHQAKIFAARARILRRHASLWGAASSDETTDEPSVDPGDLSAARDAPGA